MRCDECRELLGPLFDGELAAVEARQVMGHVEDCPSCRQALADPDRLRAGVRSAADVTLPTSLRERIRSGIDAELEPLSASPQPLLAWLRPLATHLAAAACGALFLYLLLATGKPSGLSTSTVVLAHIQALQNGQVVAISHANPHVIGPWFAGKIDYAPQVLYLAAQGYPLLGGRIDRIDQRPLASLVYGRRNHLISVLVDPAGAGEAGAAQAASFRGFQVYRWYQDGFAYWAVSDLNPAELAVFGRLLSQAG